MNDVSIPMLTPGLPGLLSLIITLALPLLVAFLAKQSWKQTYKGLLLLFLSFVKAFIEVWLNAINTAADFNLWNVLYSAVIAFMFAVGAYLGLLKKAAVTDALRNSGNTD